MPPAFEVDNNLISTMSHYDNRMYLNVNLLLVVDSISAISIVIRHKHAIDSAPNILFNRHMIEKYPHIKLAMLFISF